MGRLLNFLKQRSPKLTRWLILVGLSMVLTIAGANVATAFSIRWDSDDTPMSASSQMSETSTPEYHMAQALIQGTAGHPNLSGKILLVETPEGLNLSGRIINVPPGYHGFHIHTGNSCADNGMAAGGHFNPNQVEHGRLLQDGFQHAHAGDLGNLSVDPNGVAVLDQTFPGLMLQDSAYSVAGRTVILHEKQDDLSQPNGNAGARIGCGVINRLH
ncbi:MAG TPA: superoxide dismutase family protein [Coleofasciculaceae cyanobacterium]